MGTLNIVGTYIGSKKTIDPFLVAAKTLAVARYNDIQAQGTTTINLQTMINFYYELMKIYDNKTLSNIKLLAFPQVQGMKSDGSIIYSINNTTNFIQNTSLKKPTSGVDSGIEAAIFDGTKVTISTVDIPVINSQYLGVKINTWVDGNTLIDGQDRNTSRLFQAVQSPNIASQLFTPRISPVLGTGSIITRVFTNSGVSRLQLNKLTPITATVSLAALTKITLGARGDLVYNCNMNFYFLLVSNTFDSIDTSNKVQNLLNKYCNNFFFEPLGLLGLTQFKDFLLS